MNIKKIIPILEWLPQYNTSLFKGDVLAGITVGIILIPQGIKIIPTMIPATKSSLNNDLL